MNVLAAGHADLQARPYHDGTFRGPGGLRALIVAQGDLPGTLLGGVLHGRQRIGGLAGLAHGNDQGIPVDDGIAVPELRGVVGLGRNTRQALDPRAAHHRRVKARAHPDQDDAANVRDLAVG